MGHVSGDVEGRLKKLEDYQTKQAQQLTSLRSLVIDVHMSRLLNVVKAGRIALRCMDFTRGTETCVAVSGRQGAPRAGKHVQDEREVRFHGWGSAMQYD